MMRIGFKTLVIGVAATLLITGCAHSPLQVETPVVVPKRLTRTDLLQTARAYLGTRYRYGANHSSALDCSGFIQAVFKKYGILLPRSARDQAQIGTFVASPAALFPGDLVFFETYKRGPSHVGIYLGNHFFIHASTGRGKVTIDRLTSPYYAERFLGGKRLLSY